jgi:hypothetical protein
MTQTFGRTDTHMSTRGNRAVQIDAPKGGGSCVSNTP